MSAATPRARSPRPASGSDICLVAIGELEQITLLLPTEHALAIAKLLAKSSEVERDWKTRCPEERYYVRHAVTRFSIRNFPAECVDPLQNAPRKPQATTTATPTPSPEKEPKCPA